MISRKGYAIWIALALACGSALAEEIRWYPDVATARRAAMEYKVPVIIHFYGDNCLPCKLLEQNVYTRPEVVETLNKYFICVRVNGSQDRQMAAEYGVHSWPTDVFLGPDGKPLDQGTCKQNPGEYLGVLHNMAVLNRDRNLLLASQQSHSAKQVTSQVANYAQPALTPGQPVPGQIAPAGNAAGSQLPPAGAGVVATGNPTGPNFYAQGAGMGLQQLPGSLAPNTQVTSGPMLSQNQPQAITTAVNGAGSQIAAAAGQQPLNHNPGQLPPMQPTAQIPPATHPATVNPMQMMVAGAATTPVITPAATAAASNAWGQQPRIGNPSAQTVDNPHFSGTPPLAGTPQPGLPQPGIQQPGIQQPGLPAQELPALTGMSPAMSVATAAAQPSVSAMPPMPLVQPQNAPVAATPPGQLSINSAVPSANPAAPKIAASTVAFQARATLPAEVDRPTLMEQSTHIAATAPNGGSNAAVTPPAALEGYCPVALKAQGAWVKGQPQYAVKHRGRVYHLSSETAMQEFLQTPDASSPVLAGHDAMIFLNEGKLVEGSVQFALHEQNTGSILLFSSAESKQAYEQNYDRNTQALQIVLRKAGIGQ